MTDAIEWLDHLPAEKRMAAYLDEALSGKDRDERIWKLATELGYTHGKTLHSWITGAAKVPLRMLTPLAVQLGRDVSELLPMWIAQEMAGTDEDRLYRVVRRCVSAWEWGLIAVARDIYRAEDVD